MPLWHAPRLIIRTIRANLQANIGSMYNECAMKAGAFRFHYSEEGEVTQATRFSRLTLVALIAALLIAACAAPTPLPLTPAPATATPQPSVPTKASPAQPPGAGDNSWDRVQQAGVLRVGTSADYEPYEYYNDKFQLDGFDIALIKAIGEKLGVKVDLNDYAFDSLLGGVALDQADVAIAALSVTAERQAVADFSNVYFAGSDGVLGRPDADTGKIKDTAALAVVRLGVEDKSVYETMAQDQLINTGLMPKGNLFVYSDITRAVSDLKARRIDAVWLDLRPAEALAKDGSVKVIAQDLNQQLYAIAMKKGSTALRDKINEALVALQNDGTVAQLVQQYLNTRPEDVITPPQSLPTPAPAQPTSAPPACIDGAAWVADLSFDDKNMTAPPILNPGQPFTKGWRIQNSGTCDWQIGYALTYVSGNTPAAQMGGQPIPVTRVVKPSETFDFNANLTAPIAPGTYQGFWQMQNLAKQHFGETVRVGITVPGAATPTPAPTQTPMPGIIFTANPTAITAGQSVLFQWSASNVRAVYFYHDGQDWQNHGVAGAGQSTEYPPQTMNYYLRVVLPNNEVQVRTITISVNPAAGAPVIASFSASPASILVNQCLNVSWSVTGQVKRVTLLINNNPARDYASVSGNYQDCPTAIGTRVYQLQAFGSGGIAAQQTSINVQSNSQPSAPTPTPNVTAPPAINSLTLGPDAIASGGCTIVAWTTGGGTTRVQLLRDRAIIWDNAPLNSSVQDCPQIQADQPLHVVMVYTLYAFNNAGQQTARSANLTVYGP
jgi:ABC-type amino acid transport substrate-binding protein